MKRIKQSIVLAAFAVAVQAAAAGPTLASGYADSSTSAFPMSADEHRAWSTLGPGTEPKIDPRQYAGSPFPPSGDEHGALPAYRPFSESHPVIANQYAGSPFPDNADEHRALPAFESYAERIARQEMQQRLGSAVAKSKSE
jgi:hypothetical protein